MGFFRAVLALTVLIVHYKACFLSPDLQTATLYIKRFTGPEGGAIVNSFFVISGFYTQLLLQEKFTYRHRVVWDFYLFRFLRLFPHYYVTFLLLCLVSLAAHAWQAEAKSFMLPVLLIAQPAFTSVRFWFDNITLFHPLIFKMSHFQPLEVPLYLAIPAAWTLSVEIVFILIAPFLMRDTKRFWLTTLLSVLLAGYFLPFGEVCNYVGDTFVYFMAGAVGYKGYRRFPLGKALAGWQKKCIGYGMVCVLALGLIYYKPISDGFGEYPTYFLFMAMVIGATPVIAAFTNNLPFDRLVGQLVYPIYISQFLFFAIAMLLGIEHSFIFVLASTGLFALFSYAYVETPITGYRHRMITKSASTPA